jgi:hypothetical protein
MAGPNRAFSVSGTPADIYQGHLAYAGGSGQSSLSYLVTPFQSISARAITDRSMIWWIMNNTYTLVLAFLFFSYYLFQVGFFVEMTRLLSNISLCSGSTNQG